MSGRAASDLSADLVRQLHNLKNADLDRQISEVWGTVRDTEQDKAEMIAHYRKIATARASQPRDPAAEPDARPGRLNRAALFGPGRSPAGQLASGSQAD